MDGCSTWRSLLLLLLVLLAAWPAGASPARPDVLTGNLSVGYLRWVIGGRKGEEPATWSPAYLESLRRAGVDGVEDYITFCALEPERDRPDWAYYRRNCELVRAAGMRYGVYPWLHFAPKWFTESPEYVPYLCLEHGQPTYSTSIWAPGTLSIYDRFYRQLREALGDGVADIHASMPADYGEVGFPVGMSAWVVPQEHKHAGFWCGDRYARADFRERMRARYGTLGMLNRAWGTRFAAWDAVDYPPLEPPAGGDPVARRRWLDFTGWYADSQTEFSRKAVAAIRRYFPKTPVQLKLGYGAERVEFGVDNTGVVRMAAREGIIIRSTHGKLPPLFYKRFATACRHYGARLLTEPPAGVSREEEVHRLFNDATNLSTAYFDYPANILGAVDLLRSYLPLLEGERPHVPVAFLFPTSDHRLRPGQSLPQLLADQAQALRDVTDYDLVDENLVRDGALKEHRVLIAFEGNWLEKETLDAIAAWVRAGGTLILNAFGPMASIEGDTRVYQALVGPLAARSGDERVLVPTGQVPARMLLDIGGAEEDRFLGAGWWYREADGQSTRRWTKGEASVRIPATPGRGLRVTVYAGQTEHVGDRACLRVNGRDAGPLYFAGEAAVVQVPANLLAGRASATLTLQMPTWQPSERIPGSRDTRQLGIWVDRILVEQDGAVGGPLPAVMPPAFRVDVERVLREFSRRVGKGRVVFFPLGPDEGRAYQELVRHILYFEGRPVQPAVDVEFDGLQASVLPTRLLYYNGTDRVISRKVSLRREEFTGVPGPVPPRRDVVLDAPPHSIVAVNRSDGSVVVPHAQSSRPLDDLGWWSPNPNVAECTVHDGVLRVRTAGSDPYLIHGRRFGLDAHANSVLYLRVRTDIGHARLYWTSERRPKMADQASHGFALPADGAWHEVRVDLRAAPTWEGTLGNLRLDLDAPSGYAEFQAIRLEKAP